ELTTSFETQDRAVVGAKPAGPQAAGPSGDAPHELAVSPGLPLVADRRLLGQPPRHIEQQRRQVHGRLPTSFRDGPEGGGPGIHERRPLENGFRAHRYAAPRNDARGGHCSYAPTGSARALRTKAGSKIRSAMTWQRLISRCSSGP